MRKVGIVMGSDSDLPVMAKAVKVLEGFDIPYEVHVYSAHRTPAEAARFAEEAEENGFGVIIAGAGMAAALAGVLAAHTTLPVIGVPLKSAALDGMDALLATVMMPPGIPVATVAIDGAKNAAYLAAQILGLEDGELKKKVDEDRLAQQEAVRKKDAQIAERLKEF
ncbi:MAG: 5-(carboxyamino)imidazole ribonucleotide mutase [Solobacterium sp.]|nr:5-(carboxyamino)imidazole ribonucleotide mutase [Solobacterium sp.]